MTSQSWKTVNPYALPEKHELDDFIAKYRPKQIGEYEDNGQRVRVFESRPAEGYYE